MSRVISPLLLIALLRAGISTPVRAQSGDGRVQPYAYINTGRISGFNPGFRIALNFI
jgi:hypothetical protein